MRAGIAESTVQRSNVPVRQTPPVESSAQPRVLQIPIVEANGDGIYLKYVKRSIDVLGSVVGLVLFSPVLLKFQDTLPVQI